MKKTIAPIIHQNIDDPNLPSMVGVTYVKVSADLSQAKVYISALGAEKECLKAAEVLNGAKNLLRKLLGQKMALRHVPELLFICDDHLLTARRVDALIDKVSEGTN